MIPDRVLAAVRARLTRTLAPPARSFRPLRVDGTAAGWLDGTRFDRLAAASDVFEVHGNALSFIPALRNESERTGALDRIVRSLAADGLLTAWRDERYAIATEFGAPPWFLLERAAARYFGVHTYAVHVNGLVRGGDGIAMWIARRSPMKAIDPAMLDNLVGGGIAQGHSIASTLAKEAWEEAGIPPAVAATASRAGEVRLCREVPDGLELETIFVHDVWLSADFAPACRDGEVVEHRLVSLRNASALIANETGPDVATVDASLVIVDCLLRHGAIAPNAPNGAALERLRRPAMTP